eukprot:9536090-Karenia_brevis.AAC.1
MGGAAHDKIRSFGGKKTPSYMGGAQNVRMRIEKWQNDTGTDVHDESESALADSGRLEDRPAAAAARVWIG